MKKAMSVLIVLGLCMSFMQASGQNTIKLTFSGSHNSSHLSPDSILVENLSRQGDTMLYYPDTVLVLDLSTGIFDRPSGDPDQLSVEVVPNPFEGQTSVNISLFTREAVEIRVYDLLGRRLLEYHNTLPAGRHWFTMLAPRGGYYLFSVSTPRAVKTTRMVALSGLPVRSTQTGHGSEETPELIYTGHTRDKGQAITNSSARHSASQRKADPWQFQKGDELRFTGYATPCPGLAETDKFEAAPTTSQTYTFEYTAGVPDAAGTITGVDSVCRGVMDAIYTVPNITGAIGYEWVYTGSGLTITSGGNTNSITVNFTDSATSGDLTVYGTNACGSGAVSPAYSVAVDTSSVPAAAGNIFGTSRLCRGATGVTYFVPAVTGAIGYDWSYTGSGFSIVSGGSSNSITVNFSSGATSGALTVQGTNDCGDGLPSPAYTITVDTAVPGPVGAISGLDTVCPGISDVPYSVPGLPDATGYSWSYTDTGFTISSGNGTDSITANFSDTATSGTLSVFAGNTCGNSTDTSFFEVTVDTNLSAPPAGGPVAGPDTLCPGINGVVYSAPAIPGADSYQWTYTGDGLSITAGSDSNVIRANFAGNATSGLLKISGVNLCGAGLPAPGLSIVIDTNFVPPAIETITGLDTVCPGETGVTYSVPPVFGATGYIWVYTGDGFTITSGSNANAITASFADTATSGTLTVRGTNNCGIGPASPDFEITMDSMAFPKIPMDVMGDSTICAGDTAISYSIPPIKNASSYQWGYTGAGLSIRTPSDSNRIIADFADTATSGELTVYGVNACGNGAPSAGFTVTVDVSPPPPPVAQAATNPDGINLEANWSAAAGAMAYYLDVATDAGFTNIVPGYDSLNVGNVTTFEVTGIACFTDYYYRVRAGNGCDISSFSNTITVNSRDWGCGCPITYDGQTYETVQIGSQCWMAENLNVGARIDGGVPQANNLTIEKYCYIDWEGACDTYGGLYQWDEAMGHNPSDNGNPGTTQGICPTGWHIPTHAEWSDLENTVDANKMKDSPPGWNGTNESGFTALPAGKLDFDEINGYDYEHLNSVAHFWSATEISDLEARYRALSGGWFNLDDYKNEGRSIRCVLD